MAVMDAAFDPIFGEAWTRRQVIDALAGPGTHSWLAGLDGKPFPQLSSPEDRAGAAGFALSRGGGGDEELLLLAVHPACRRRGVGRALLRRFITEARGRGATQLFLEMREGNVAEQLYLRHGFRQIGRRRNYYRSGSGGHFDALTFAWRSE